ncbi:MAG: MFS transporter [Chthoniobacterales bacterium]|nr:MFS transporter [Chthoniobacterales bacterium]
MRDERSSNPVTYFFLLLPYGISNGFVSITLPFALVRAVFSVAAAASVVALGLSANLWRFVGAPVVDLTLSLRRWYWLGMGACVATLLGLGLMPLRPETAILLTVVAFVSQIGANLVVIPVGGLIAHTVPEDEKGRAAGWYQAGNLGGTGIGGGAGVWMASHFSFLAAGGTLAGAMLIAGLALRFVPDVRPVRGESIGRRMRLMGRDLFILLRTPIGLLTIALVTSPIGSGAMNNLWSAVALDWHTGANTVALVTGVLNGIIAAVGCVAGGWLADRVGRWWAYFGSGIFLAVVAAGMAIAARTSAAFSTGVLFYAFVGGVAYAAFSALVLFAIGRGAASTKYALLSSFGNLPVIYVTALDGWTHDRYGSAGMLLFEALAGIVSVLLAAIAVWRLWQRGAIAR